ncbi:hypothetical protein NSTC745_06545 [Nostoc sp. DSM 114161]|jgi:hypothetical protein
MSVLTRPGRAFRPTPQELNFMHYFSLAMPQRIFQKSNMSPIEINQETEKEKILCSHCQRTATNGIKCKGICVADSDY